MKKPILVQGAMEIEIEILKEKLVDIREIIIDGYVFYKGMYKNYPIIISLTQIGSINSTISTLLAVKEFSPLCIINQGISGGQKKDIHQGDLIIGTECKNSASRDTLIKEEGTGVNPFEWKITNFFDQEDEITEYKSDEYLLNIVQEESKNYENGLVHVGILGSADTWDKEADYVIWLNKNLGIISADMESIGTYTVAQKYKIPVIGIRVISDNAIVHEIYDRNVASYSQEFVLRVIERLIRDKE